MGIKRYYSTGSTQISTAYQSNLKMRMTGSNFGASDILETFSIIGQASASSIEVSRILLQFPVLEQISSDRTNGIISASGSTTFVLKMFNAPHGETLPRNYTLNILPLSRSFESGFGLDLEEGTDITRNGVGANWLNAGSGTLWTTQGGDFISSSLSATFDQGYEDLQTNITSLVETWLNGAIKNNGVVVKLPQSLESGSQSYYTKRFFTRTSEHFFKRPYIEAQWDSSTKDDRQRFFVSSSLLSSTDNTHTIYLYNLYGGLLKNIPSIGTGAIYLQVYTSASQGSILSTTPSVVTGGWTSTGIYSASFALSTTASIAYDIWFSGSSVYHTGTVYPKQYDNLDTHLPSRKYITTLTNLKQKYSVNEQSRLVLFTREYGWQPNLYSVVSQAIPNVIIDNVYYRVVRESDNNIVIDFGTGSAQHTKLSYDGQGNFFPFDFSMLEPNYGYYFQFAFLLDGSYEIQDYRGKFRIVE